jgi:folate-binding protein YgfZ
VEKQSPEQLALNGYCTAKGRLLASVHQWVDPERVSLIVSRPLAAPLAKRLSMFVLRAKAKVHERSASYLCLGLAGVGIGPALAAFGLQTPLAGTVERGADESVALGLDSIVVDTQPIPCALLVLPIDRLGKAWPALTEHLQPLSSVHWRWTEVLAGRPRITPRTSEHFVPQMVNLDLVGGVSFKKGCYPGQEVVARSHYLGKLKRRMFGGSVALPMEPAASLAMVSSGQEGGPVPGLGMGTLPEPGEDVFPASGAEPCGEVVLAAHAPGGGIVLLFESQISEASGARLGGVAGAPSSEAAGGKPAQASDHGGRSAVLDPFPLPYPVPCA